MKKTSDLATQQLKIQKIVEDYFLANSHYAVPFYLTTAENKDHIVITGTSILMTKWGIGYRGGGFVQAVVDNDLTRAFANADDINQHAMKFYTMLMYNVGMPSDL